MCWRDGLSNDEWWEQYRAELRIREALRQQRQTTADGGPVMSGDYAKELMEEVKKLIREPQP
jgi:hypothetical protein